MVLGFAQPEAPKAESPKQAPADKTAPVNPAVVPAARGKEHAGWWQRHEAITARVKQGYEKGDVGMIFIGDSITEGWELGAQVLSPHVVRPNCSVHLSLPIEEGALPCRARVVWAAFEQSRRGGPVWYRAGVKFTHVDTTAVETFAIEHGIADDVKRAAAE